MLNSLSSDVKQYLIITANYWAFTLTDGALRMLVVLHFHALGYSPLEIALLFVFYEFFGIVTNLLGGVLGARFGLNQTMNVGLALQILALTMLMIPQANLTVVWMMAAQALSGIAKDLNKMSAKSAIKLLIPDEQSNTLYLWVARLTGSKNTLKGAGFFVGGVLLFYLGFQVAVMSMAACLGVVWIISLSLLRRDLGKAKHKPKLKELLSKSSYINHLSVARMLLFGARDVWFVVALPVYFSQQLGWSPSATGTFMATWIIVYGLVQTQAPKFTRSVTSSDGSVNTKPAFWWVALLSVLPLSIAILLSLKMSPGIVLIGGLIVFGIIFAINSSMHSFLIVHAADGETVSLDVGFYYMANAAGRLIGTVLSGLIYQAYGLEACLIVSTTLLILAAAATARMQRL